jgi:peptidoglycan/xylan/chitin deacetylase (PgdA/CDA1 family)
MQLTSIMYHDIVGDGDWSASGFGGSHADIYKLDAGAFEDHLKLLVESNVRSCLVSEMNEQNRENCIAITFDDGGESAYTHSAELLETHGFRGHFFVATEFIDTPTFLKTGQIRELVERGHVIGSHSASHPTRMASCTTDELRSEWRDSVKKLSDIIGKPVTTASVPGGYFSRRVAETAAECGIGFLFNSEPVTRVYEINGCKVFGRYTIKQNTSVEMLGKIVRGNVLDKFQQYAFWNSKKIAKKLGGRIYVNATRKILEK